MYLRDLLDVNEYKRMVDEGYIAIRKHPEFDLYISGYTPQTQFEHRWNRSTMVCRGLITDSHDKIIARPWSKFFNIGEQDLMVGFDDPVEITDKMDGSLGILYRIPNSDSYAVSTRGSFESDQAVHATRVWKGKYANLHDWMINDDFTYLFEIVYPENRILLNYGDQDDLVLLGAVHKAQGFYYGPQAAAELLEWTGPVTEVMPYNTISEALSHTNRPNAEGFVVRYHNYLVKLKQPDYVTSHRLRFELTDRRVWENLVAGKDIREIVMPLPDEFQQDIMDIANDLIAQFDKLKQECYDCFNSVKERVGLDDRAVFAREAQKVKHRAAMFTILDNKSIDDYVWKRIKP